jgi:hypothetical protein
MNFATALTVRRATRAWRDALARWHCAHAVAGVLVIGLALAPGTGSAEATLGSVSAAAVKVAFVYNFGKFVEWPAATFTAASRFNVCTAGDVDEFRPALADIEGHRLQGLQVHVRQLGKSTDFAECHTLLIAQSERDRLPDILRIAQAQHILTVSDIDDFADSGGIIGLLMRNGRVQFDINAHAAKSAELSLSSELMALAHAVVGQAGDEPR